MKRLPPEHTKFKKGQSGNPNGRPKKLDIKQVIQEAFAQEKNGMNGLQAMVLKMLHAAINKGDIRAAEFLIKYAFGTPKPVQNEEEAAARQIITYYTVEKDED
jgi:hypothetical protein